MNMRRPTTERFAEAAADTIATIRTLAAVQGSLDEHGGAPFFAARKAIQQMRQADREVRDGLLGLAVSGIQVCWAAADDYMASLEADLRRRPHAVWSGMTLARAVQEAVIFVCYIAEPRLSLDERLVRIADTWLEDANNRVKASPATHPSGEDYLGEATKDRDYCVAELRRGGFTVGTSATGVPKSVSLGSFSVNKIGFSTTARAKLLMPPDAPEPYRLASGAAHARPWFLTKNALQDNGGGWSSRLDVTGSSVSIVAYAVLEGVRALGGFYGVDTSSTEGQISNAHKELLRTFVTESGAA